MTRIFVYSVDSSDSCSFSYGWMRGLLEVLRNTNSPNDTNFCFIRLIRVIRGLLEVLKNTNDPNDTNINAAGLLEIFKEHE